MPPAAHQGEPPAMRQLRLWLGALDRIIAAAVDRQNAIARELSRRPLLAHAITPEHASGLAEQSARLSRAGYPVLPDIALEADEQAADAALAASTREQGLILPLERLEREAGLAAHERAVLIILAAAEMSPLHERLYAYLGDDLGRAHASVDLALLLTSGTSAPEAVRRHALGPAGLLRRLGLVAAVDGPASTARTVLRLTPGVLDWLSGARATPPMRLRDPDQIDRPEPCAMPRSAETALAISFLSGGSGLVGIWGEGDRAALAEGLACASGRPLRRLFCNDPTASLDVAVAEGLALASGCDAIAWLELDGMVGIEVRGDRLAAALASRPQPIIISGREPWRPAAALRDGRYAELQPVPTDSHAVAQSLAARIRRGCGNGLEVDGSLQVQRRTAAHAGGPRQIQGGTRCRADRAHRTHGCGDGLVQPCRVGRTAPRAG